MLNISINQKTNEKCSVENTNKNNNLNLDYGGLIPTA